MNTQHLQSLIQTYLEQLSFFNTNPDAENYGEYLRGETVKNGIAIAAYILPKLKNFRRIDKIGLTEAIEILQEAARSEEVLDEAVKETVDRTTPPDIQKLMDEAQDRSAQITKTREVATKAVREQIATQEKARVDRQSTPPTAPEPPSVILDEPTAQLLPTLSAVVVAPDKLPTPLTTEVAEKIVELAKTQPIIFTNEIAREIVEKGKGTITGEQAKKAATQFAQTFANTRLDPELPIVPAIDVQILSESVKHAPDNIIITPAITKMPTVELESSADIGFPTPAPLILNIKITGPDENDLPPDAQEKTSRLRSTLQLGSARYLGYGDPKKTSETGPAIAAVTFASYGVGPRQVEELVKQAKKENQPSEVIRALEQTKLQVAALQQQKLIRDIQAEFDKVGVKAELAKTEARSIALELNRDGLFVLPKDFYVPPQVFGAVEINAANKLNAFAAPARDIVVGFLKSKATGMAKGALAKTGLGLTLKTAAKGVISKISTTLGGVFGGPVGAAVAYALTWLGGKIVGFIAKHKKEIGKVLAGALLLGGFVFGSPVAMLLGAGVGVAAFGGLAPLAGGIAGFIGSIGALTVGAIGIPILITLIATPLVVAFMLFVINTGAFVVPVGPPVPGSSFALQPPNLGIVANGSCPLVGDYFITESSYNAGSETGHGSNNYWGSSANACNYPIPIGFLGGCSAPPYSSSPNNICAQRTSIEQCPYYGYAVDVAAGSCADVALPSLCDAGSTSCDSLTWNLVTSWYNCGGQSVSSKSACSGSFWGYGAVFSAQGNGHTWTLYLNHIDLNVPPQLVSGAIIGTATSDLGCSSTHIHIELVVDGVPVRPDFMCGG